MNFHVTESHIVSGVRYECDICPVALAITSRLPMNVSCEITNAYYFITGPEPGQSFKGFLPKEVSWFISQFDRQRKVEPIVFELPIPIWAQGENQ